MEHDPIAQALFFDELVSAVQSDSFNPTLLEYIGKKEICDDKARDCMGLHGTA